jgi:hypothetical protein
MFIFHKVGAIAVEEITLVAVLVADWSSTDDIF